jgi:hypothetical protein
VSDLQALRRLAIIGVVLAIVLAFVSTALGLAAVGDLEAFAFGHVETILRGGPQAAPLWRWAMLLDVFYSYLLLVPLALYVHRLLRDRKPWLADLGLVGALAYMLLGAASAAGLAIAGSSLIAAYATAPPAEQVAIQTSFQLLRDIFYFGVWQMLDAITAGTWVLSSGWLLLVDRPRLGSFLVLLGGGLWILALMTMVGVHSLAVLAAIFGGVLAVWLIWILIDQKRRTSPAD